MALLCVVMVMLSNAACAPLMIFLNEQYPTELRANGTAVSWNLGFMLGGLMPTLVSLLSPQLSDVPSRLAIFLVGATPVFVIGSWPDRRRRSHLRLTANEWSPGSEGFADRAVQGEQGPHSGHAQGRADGLFRADQPQLDVDAAELRRDLHDDLQGHRTEGGRFGQVEDQQLEGMRSLSVDDGHQLDPGPRVEGTAWTQQTGSRPHVVQPLDLHGLRQRQRLVHHLHVSPRGSSPSRSSEVPAAAPAQPIRAAPCPLPALAGA
ncbi:hypothetical protein Amsp01_043070 [Amycolatopsis sp. NBRC 101858]|nr:hypothetical protein [Amycolatopsis sp. NBRC 101858]GLY38283.1 hypothetical protein Amsp01_043070 [Amycolatopsis sp. NBRC 101858]